MAGVLISAKDFIVRVQFDDESPDVNELVAVQNGYGTQLLVDHLEPGGIAFCLNVRSDLRLVKGMVVQRTHKGIEIPVGEPTIGRLFNALGDPLDGQGKLVGEVSYKDILKLPPRTSNFTIAKPEILETGIKV
ncbi:MAG TPA: hypothetical protein VIJ68_02880, partial [Candidatus Saccharimonadales bacterium]